MTKVIFLATVADPLRGGIVFGQGMQSELGVEYEGLIADWRSEGKVSLVEEPVEEEPTHA